MYSGGDKPGNMSHIHHEQSTDLVGNSTKSFKIYCSRIGTGPGNDHLWPVFKGDALHLFHINGFAITSDPVGDEII